MKELKQKHLPEACQLYISVDNLSLGKLHKSLHFVADSFSKTITDRCNLRTI